MSGGLGGGFGGTSSPTKIEFLLDPATGLVESIKVSGVTGARCAEVTRPFEQLFGGERTDVKTPEFYQHETVRQQQKIGGI